MRLIDAKDLYERIKEHHDLYVNAWGSFKNLPADDKARVDAYTCCIAEVVNSQTIDAVPVVHARWYMDKGWRCSNCHKEAHDDELCDPIFSNFCPNCGAKMDGEPDG